MLGSRRIRLHRETRQHGSIAGAAAGLAASMIAFSRERSFIRSKRMITWAIGTRLDRLVRRMTHAKALLPFQLRRPLVRELKLICPLMPRRGAQTITQGVTGLLPNARIAAPLLSRGGVAARQR